MISLKNNKNVYVFILASVFVLVGSTALAAGRAAVTWAANGESDLEGYRLYYGTSSHSGTCPTLTNPLYTSSVDTGNVTSYYVDGLTAGQTYYFQLTAHDTSQNESGCSTEVSRVITYASDFNNDHAVNGLDFNILRTYYFRTNVCGNVADANHDCSVNGLDFSNMRGDYFRSF